MSRNKRDRGMDYLPRVRLSPRNGQITSLPLVSLGLVDSTRVDRQGRLHREQVGQVIKLDATRAYVRTIAAEIHYRKDSPPKLYWRLDRWDKKRAHKDGPLAWHRHRTIRLQDVNMRQVLGMFGATKGRMDPRVAKAYVRLMEARDQYELDQGAYLAERAAAQAQEDREAQENPEEPQGLPDVDDMVM